MVMNEIQLFAVVFALPISLMFSYIIDRWLGDPLWLPHPIVAIGKLTSFLEKKYVKSQNLPRC